MTLHWPHFVNKTSLILFYLEFGVKSDKEVLFTKRGQCRQVKPVQLCVIVHNWLCPSKKSELISVQYIFIHRKIEGYITNLHEPTSNSIRAVTFRLARPTCRQNQLYKVSGFVNKILNLNFKSIHSRIWI